MHKKLKYERSRKLSILETKEKRSRPRREDKKQEKPIIRSTFL